MCSLPGRLWPQPPPSALADAKPALPGLPGCLLLPACAWPRRAPAPTRAAQTLGERPGSVGEATSCCLSGDGTLLLTSSRHGPIKLWDLRRADRALVRPHRRRRCPPAPATIFPCNTLPAATAAPHPAPKSRLCGDQVRYTGHQNSASSFIRCGFGARESVVVSGSDDGKVHIWESGSGRVLSTLPGHPGRAVYRGVWSPKQGLLATCGEDGAVRTWCYK